ncbi:hypothetical protein [Pseudoroseomonas cervicalis]|uniref:hypothetical protein n=1 Tax=Teichococcus cervicalis TaxID=204525 RepID=UPI002787AC0B|nr:hypothetical protein [Pseudoroseomonas cervicalis]MDQ1081423.1 hypothetical protein [Pseudoroseomonas cervicalis]
MGAGTLQHKAEVTVSRHPAKPLPKAAARVDDNAARPANAQSPRVLQTLMAEAVRCADAYDDVGDIPLGSPAKSEADKVMAAALARMEAVCFAASWYQASSKEEALFCLMLAVDACQDHENFEHDQDGADALVERVRRHVHAALHYFGSDVSSPAVARLREYYGIDSLNPLKAIGEVDKLGKAALGGGDAA